MPDCRRVRQNLPMPAQVSFKLGGSQRDWLTLRRRDNPFSAVGGPLPQITIPLEARVSDRGVSVEILRLAFDLKIGTTLVGQGEIGPNTYLRTEPSYLPATATCPQPATGACCARDGTCSVRTNLQCTAAHGIYRGDNVTCASAGCVATFCASRTRNRPID